MATNARNDRKACSIGRGDALFGCRLVLNRAWSVWWPLGHSDVPQLCHQPGTRQRGSCSRSAAPAGTRARSIGSTPRELGLHSRPAVRAVGGDRAPPCAPPCAFRAGTPRYSGPSEPGRRARRRGSSALTASCRLALIACHAASWACLGYGEGCWRARARDGLCGACGEKVHVVLSVRALLFKKAVYTLKKASSEAPYGV